MTDRYMKPEERLGLTPQPLPEQESSEAEESIPQKKQFISQTRFVCRDQSAFVHDIL